MTGPEANAVAFFASGILFGCACLVSGRYRHTLVISGLGAAVLVLECVFLWRFGVDFSSWRIGASALGMVPIAITYSIPALGETIGLPWWIARRTGLGVRHPWLKFYRELALLRTAMAKSIEHGRKHTTNRAESLEAVARYLDLMRSLTPPYEDWEAYRSAVVAWGRNGITLLQRKARGADWQAHERAAVHLDTMVASLRPGMVDRIGLNPVDVPHLNNRSYIVVGCSGFLVWIGWALKGPGSIDQADPLLWLKLTAVSAGLVCVASVCLWAANIARQWLASGSD